MKLITKHTDYAMRALSFMAKSGEQLFTVSDLSKKLKISQPFLRMIFQTLSKRHILKSFKGQGGGFRFAKPPDKIFISDLIEIFQKPIRFNPCFIKEDLCPDIKTCPMRKKIKEIDDYVNKELGSITIKSMLD